MKKNVYNCSLNIILHTIIQMPHLCKWVPRTDIITLKNIDAIINFISEYQ